ncbi:alpha-E domain-containing protein [Muricauda sp. JGD-17]|uniref:Alpha-E domain-containing protein n=1 Tax=Flagellimonas ochracea TaxID=2696472 RepID=A0A964TA81_9FLAO|nr:alpha-E domain-containing protein [Allomuricauda ochracea]NAY91122.1 alpha-E domain-containing protein [Allomuricauda ochracea]
MLSRVANNLFWMGRYIERAEHVARFMNVNYFSSLDAPNQLSQSRQFVLQSMLFMVGNSINDASVDLDEEQVLYDIALNPEESYSIINSIKNARENANSSRDLISTELYESLNKFYHFVMKYPKEAFVKTNLYDFTINVSEMTAVLRGKIRGTLLHDKVYAVIMMGVNIERAIQINRIINTKFNDAQKAQGGYGDTMANSFEWSTLLKCAESYDMMRRLYKKAPTSTTTLEFLLLNSRCPRSFMNCINQVYNHVKELENKAEHEKHSTAFLVGKVRAEFEFKRIEEITEDVQGCLNGILDKMFKISESMEKEFFGY